MTRLFTILGMLVFCGSAAYSQKRCVKGIPCGNTCIAANKTCRVGAGTATKADAPTPTPTPAPVRDTTLASRDSTLAWLASRTGSTFYLNSPACPMVKVLRGAGSSNVVYFKKEEDAVKYGLVKSALRDCS